MTQMITNKGFSLRRLTGSVRVLITLFLCSSAAATALGILMFRLRTGLKPEGAVDYYVAGAGAARSPLEMLDSTHPHLFAMAFLVFVLGHLFALTDVSGRIKTWLALLAFGGVFVDAAAPWVISFLWHPFSVIQMANTAVLTVVLVAYLAVPLYEMWLAPSGFSS